MIKYRFIKCSVKFDIYQHFDEDDPIREIKERGGATGGTCDGCSTTVDRLLVYGELGGEESMMFGLAKGCDGAK